MRTVDETHDSALRSWVSSADDPGDFPIQNLPFGVFRAAATNNAPRVGVAIGNQILDLPRCREVGLLEGLPSEIVDALGAPTLNAMMSLGTDAMARLRPRLSKILAADGWGSDERTLVPMAAAELLLPAAIGDYSDFYTSLYHATNVGHLFRRDQPLFPNFKHLPVGYHGRSSSIVCSGTPVARPRGQRKPAETEAPMFGPSERLDYELEVGAFVGAPNDQGQPIAVNDAERHLFGLCLLNDWSARDIQVWESQPLGPFLAKSFATTISPWVVTLEALAPFRAPAAARAPDDPSPLPYLRSDAVQSSGAFDVVCEVYLRSSTMRTRGEQPVRISRNSFREMYWTFAQMTAHHTSNGCNLRAGDLLGSGTVSGPTDDSLGCLLELTRGPRPIVLPTGERRLFLADGDEVIFRARCQREGFTTIGFGECRGTVSPAV
jgi:fumarylacetoacetase